MDPSIQIFQPSRLYLWTAWAALAGTLVGIACGLRAPFAFVPTFFCMITAAALFWLATRPRIMVAETQFNIGERAIAWREVREINTSRFNANYFISPLVLMIKLTNSRRKILIFPGDASRIGQLTYQLRKHSQMATFDGVTYRDYWAWSNVTGSRPDKRVSAPPVRIVNQEDEEEIERMYQKLKTVGHLDSRSTDPSKTTHED